MNRTPLQELASLTGAVQAAEEARMRTLAAEETRIRQKIADLEARQRHVLALDEAELSGPRSVGADILWQEWAGRSRRELQIRLAHALAQKGAALRQLRRAHGRAMATGTLLDKARKAEHAQSEKQRIAREQELILLKSGMPFRSG